MSVQKTFSKAKTSHIFKEWRETERGNDPLINAWLESKRSKGVCKKGD